MAIYFRSNIIIPIQASMYSMEFAAVLKSGAMNDL